MLVEFCDQVFGNSTPRCSNAGLSGLPMIASRISHSIMSKGWVPASVKRRLTRRPPSPLTELFWDALLVAGMTSPLCRSGGAAALLGATGGGSKTGLLSGRNTPVLQDLDRELIGARNRLRFE